MLGVLGPEEVVSVPSSICAGQTHQAKKEGPLALVWGVSARSPIGHGRDGPDDLTARIGRAYPRRSPYRFRSTKWIRISCVYVPMIDRSAAAAYVAGDSCWGRLAANSATRTPGATDRVDGEVTAVPIGPCCRRKDWPAISLKRSRHCCRKKGCRSRSARPCGHAAASMGHWQHRREHPRRS